jgi:predicted ATP-dependent endonuclease of OLD family
MLPSLIHLSKTDGNTYIRQILQDDWNDIVSSNGMIDELAKKHPKLANTLKTGVNKSDFEALRYFLCLNAERANAFFSSHTILVEGGSEVGLINRLIDDGLVANGSGVCIFDSFGKYNIHRFMNLFGKLGIRHSVMMDDDSDKTGEQLKLQQDVNQMIRDSKNDFTSHIVTVPGNLELLLDIKLGARSDQKPQALLLKYDSGAIDSQRIRSLVALVEQCLK